jgi:hypothetical protein
VVALHRRRGEARLGESDVEVVQVLHPDLGRRSLAERLGADPAGDAAVALDRAGLPTTPLELVDVHRHQCFDGHVGGDTVPVDLGHQLGQRLVGVSLATPEGPAHVPAPTADRITPGVGP